MDQAYYWDKFKLEIFIRCKPEQAFRAWATKSGIQSWFRNDVRVQRNGSEISATEVFQSGDNMKWADLVGDDLYPSKVIEVVNNQYLQITFDSETVRVTNEFKAVDGGTLVTLTQDKMPVDENGKAAWHLSCFAGWTFRLANMKSVLEGGKDLREISDMHIFKPAKYIYDESWK